MKKIEKVILFDQKTFEKPTNQPPPPRDSNTLPRANENTTNSLWLSNNRLTPQKTNLFNHLYSPIYTLEWTKPQMDKLFQY